MSKSNLTNLKSETLQAQKELDIILKVTNNKQSILDDLLLRIGIAQKSLEDGFSEEKLQLEKNLVSYKKSIMQEMENLNRSRNELNKKYQSLIESYNITENNLERLRLESKKEEDKLLYLKSVINTQEKQLAEYNAQLSPLKTDIQEAKSLKLTLDKELAEKKTAYKRSLTEMLTEAEKDKTRINKESEKTKEVLMDTKLQLEEVRIKIDKLQEDYKQKENSLISRENSLVIKTKAFNKDQQDFEIEMRRAGYIKPLI